MAKQTKQQTVTRESVLEMVRPKRDEVSIADYVDHVEQLLGELPWADLTAACRAFGTDAENIAAAVAAAKMGMDLEGLLDALDGTDDDWDDDWDDEDDDEDWDVGDV